MKVLRNVFVCAAVALILGYAVPHGVALVVEDCDCSGAGLKDKCRGGTCSGGSIAMPAECSTCCDGPTCKAKKGFKLQ